MHSLIRFRDMLPFSIKGVVDPVGRRFVGQDSGDAIRIPPTGIKIQSNLRAALKEADTLILGYVDKLSSLKGNDILGQMVKTALECSCNIYSFLPVSGTEHAELLQLAKERGLTIHYPTIPIYSFDRDRYNYTPDLVDVPLISILGTSAQQGKFTLQLILRKELQKLGYKVAQLGTEHHCSLFGIESTVPMGYGTPPDISYQDISDILDFEVKRIAHEYTPEIIITGAQSGTIPFDIIDRNHHTLSAISFLFGVKPDACILVVNSVDPQQYIQDTIDAIRILAKAPTILLAMSDREKQVNSAYGRNYVWDSPLNQKEIQKKLTSLEDTTGLPAIQITSEIGQQKMVQEILRHFQDNSSTPGAA